MDGVVMLPQRLDAHAAERLATDLLEHQGQALILNAGAVERISALALEVIIAAGLQWERDGMPIQLVSGSANFVAACTTLGLNVEQPWRAQAEITAGE